MTISKKKIIIYLFSLSSNIPNGDISKGDLIVPYLQPLPMKGTGYHRFVFVLYKQDKKLDLSEYKISDLKNLESRTFNTYEFYKKYQDNITPAGLSFFQAKWDESTRDVFHNVFGMKQPIFEYDFPEIFLKKEKQFPHREAFNLYMDRYAEAKDVNKRYLEQRLAKTHPFDGPEKPLRFPAAQPFTSYVPSWRRTAIKNERLKRGRINDVN
jgi:large subunit ribosomal protein L38